MSNNPDEMFAKLYALAGTRAAPKGQSEKQFPKKFTTKAWAARSQQDGKWNSSILQVTKNFVAEGKTDEAIHAVTDGLTTDGYSIEQTRKQVQPMLDGARAKFGDGAVRNTANICVLLIEDKR